MTWGLETARALTETFEGSLDSPFALGVVVVDDRAVTSDVRPEESPSGLFDIGSITKTMTATVLATLAVDGSLTLDDPVGRWLDAGSNGETTLVELATHTSGLPRLAPNAFDWPGFDDDDPYAGYTAEMAEEGLRATATCGAGAPPRDSAGRGRGPTEARRQAEPAGQGHRADEMSAGKDIVGRGEAVYSNFGYQLLGLCLCRATGMRYADLIRRRLFEPAAMGTATVRGEPSEAPVLPGHAGGREVPQWHLQVPGPGGVLTSVADMAAYLRAVLDPPPGLAEAIDLATGVHELPGTEHRGLGWAFLDDGLMWHNGGTAGHRAMCAVDRSRRRAAALMVTSGDFGDQLDKAVVLAMGGDDPRAQRPTAPGPEWAEYARELAGLVASAAFSDLYARLDPGWCEELSLADFEAEGRSILERAGAHVRTGTPVVTRRGSQVSMTVPFVFENGEWTLSAVATPDRAIVGLRVDRAGERR